LQVPSEVWWAFEYLPRVVWWWPPVWCVVCHQLSDP
jgi:hypothetical protein